MLRKNTELADQLFPKGAAGLKEVNESKSEAGVTRMTKDAYRR